MKRFLLMVFFLCLIPSMSYAALGSATVWEVRPATGSNLNGGCYDATVASAGPDATLTGTALQSFTDLTAVASTTVTSVAALFTSAMVGNCLHVESGIGTPGFLMITAFTNASTITVDRSVTITAGDGKVGGATASLGGQTTTSLAASLVAGNTVYVKNEAWNEAVSLTVSGTGGVPITVEGYNTTRGDAPIGATRPTNARAAAGAVGFLVSGNHYQIKNMIVSGAGTIGFSFTGIGLRGINLRATANGAAGFNITNTNVSIIACEADLNTTSGLVITNASVTVNYCTVHHNTTSGIAHSGAGLNVLTNNLIHHNSSHGLAVTANASLVLLHNTFDCNTSAASCGAAAIDGINVASAIFLAAQTVVMNNIFSNNGRYGFNQVTAVQNNNDMFIDYNDYFGNGTAARANVPTGAHDLALNPTYVDAANGNYAIGTPLQAQGYPGLFPAGTTTGFRDMGAVQRQNLIQVGSHFHVFP